MSRCIPTDTASWHRNLGFPRNKAKKALNSSDLSGSPAPGSLALHQARTLLLSLQQTEGCACPPRVPRRVIVNLKRMYPSPPSWFLPAPRQSSVFRLLPSRSPCLFFLQNLHCPVQLSGQVCFPLRLCGSRGVTPLLSCVQSWLLLLVPPLRAHLCKLLRWVPVRRTRRSPRVVLLPRHLLAVPCCSAGLPAWAAQPAWTPPAAPGPLRVPATPVTSARLAGTRFRAATCPSPMARASWCLRMGSL